MLRLTMPRPFRTVYLLALTAIGAVWIGWPAVVLLVLASFDFEVLS